MKKRVQISSSEQAEINVSPLIDMVYSTDFLRRCDIVCE